MPVRDVKPSPPARRNTLYFEAHRLATLPRGKYADYTQTAFWTVLATITAGVAALYDLLLDKPSQPKILDVALIVIPAICIAITVLGVFQRDDVQTSEAYLKELYGVPPELKRKRRWYFLWLY